MGREEIRQHVMSISCENTERTNKAPNDQANSITFCNSVTRWCDFLRKHFSFEKKAILVLSVFAVFLDPLFFYIPVVKNDTTCVGLDDTWRIIVVFFRSFVDVLHTILWCQHRLPSIKKKYKERKYVVILAGVVVILSILPLPQVAILAEPWQKSKMDMLRYSVLVQFGIRVCRIFPTYKDATKSSDMLLIYAWFAAAFNLIIYTVFSNVFGAYWYLRAVKRNIDCWKEACNQTQSCDVSSLYCDNTSSPKQYLLDKCSAQAYDYGIYEDAFKTIFSKKDIPFQDRLFHCLWWGLRHLSSLGENLEPTSNLLDNLFAILTILCSLVLFASFIGNMQIYLQSKTPRILEKMRQRGINLKGWGPYKSLSEDLKEKVKWCAEPKWRETIEVDLEILLNNTSSELNGSLRADLCKDMLKKIPKLKNGRHDKLCALAKPVVFPQRSYIFREGDPIHELVFVVTGDVLAYSKCNAQLGVATKRLSKGCFFGEELLQQCEQVTQQQVDSEEYLPMAKITVQAITKVEALALSANDLKKVFT